MMNINVCSYAKFFNTKKNSFVLEFTNKHKPIHRKECDL